MEAEEKRFLGNGMQLQSSLFALRANREAETHALAKAPNSAFLKSRQKFKKHSDVTEGKRLITVHTTHYKHGNDSLHTHTSCPIEALVFPLFLYLGRNVNYINKGVLG